MSKEDARHIHLLGVPLDHGAGRRGVGMGPSALRIAGLHRQLERLGFAVHDLGDLEVPIPETISVGDANARYLPDIASTCERVAERVRGILSWGAFPLIVGGDHSISIGTLSGVAAHLRVKKRGRLGVIWFDAHGDINTPETSPSGNIHGMPVACLLGRGPDQLTRICFEGPKVTPERFVQVGLRDLDPQERSLLRDSGILAYTMEAVDRRGMPAVMEEALQALSDIDHLHLSFDVDSLDPEVAPGTGTQKLGGLTLREAHLACEMIAETGRLGSMEMVEVNPTLDVRNRTAEMAVGLIASALGRRIL